MAAETEQIDGVLGFEVQGGVALLTLNRPESLNALNSELQRAIGEALVRIRDDDAIRVGVIRGNGRAFCAGVDLKERAAREAQGDAKPAEVFATSSPPSYVTFDAKKPLIASIHGHCLAGGLELALSCDLRLASEGARFGLPEIQRGFFPGGGGPQRLMRQLPHAVALDLLLTGEPVDAEAALRAGIVSRVFSEDDLPPKTMEVARRIAGYAPLAVRSLRELSYASTDLSLDRSLRFGNSLRWIIGQTADAKEGPRAFTEKREPHYRGE
jgi:E-phenylitaconyl-CoA hydratase